MINPTKNMNLITCINNIKLYWFFNIKFIISTTNGLYSGITIIILVINSYWLI